MERIPRFAYTYEVEPIIPEAVVLHDSSAWADVAIWRIENMKPVDVER